MLFQFQNSYKKAHLFVFFCLQKKSCKKTTKMQEKNFQIRKLDMQKNVENNISKKKHAEKRQ